MAIEFLGRCPGLLTERRWRALNILQRFNDGSNDAFRLLGQRRTR